MQFGETYTQSAGKTIVLPSVSADRLRNFWTIHRRRHAPDEAVSAGSRPLQILQMEESADFKSNIGFAEVSGEPVTLDVEVFSPSLSAPVLLPVELKPNQFKQLSLREFLGLGDKMMFNARISVSVKDGKGRALAYGSLIDLKTGDPTYIPGQ